MNLKVDDCELGTILAGLRAWQLILINGNHLPPGYYRDLRALASESGTIEPLLGPEIDALCERLNCGGEE